MNTAPPSWRTNSHTTARLSVTEDDDMQVMGLTGTPHRGATWLAASKRSLYTVFLEDDAWTGTCLDFTGRCQRQEGYDVIEADNDLFRFRWSFDLLSEPHMIRWDKVVTFYDQRARKKVPVLGEDGNPATEIAGAAYITGRITVELDGWVQAYWCHAPHPFLGSSL